MWTMKSPAVPAAALEAGQGAGRRAFELAPANLPGLPFGRTGIGDSNCRSPGLRGELAAAGVTLHAALHSRKKGPDPEWAKARGRERRLVEAVQGQLAGRYDVKRARARDVWHLARRATRKALSHTVAVMLCVRSRPPPPQLAPAGGLTCPHEPAPGAHPSFNDISGPLQALF
jgi:hypothetical protein